MRRIVVGVDNSPASVVALRWACREASLRGAEVHAVHVREEQCHSFASYAIPAAEDPDDFSLDDLAKSAQADTSADVEVRTEIVDGLPARVLLDRCAGADMLVLGTATESRGALRSAGPVIRACLRRAACPVVVISAPQETMPRIEQATRSTERRVKLPATAGV